MELRQLVYFEAVARCGGFSRAAEDLRIAQPAVSAQIRRLERELGTPLLARTTRRVALTAAGELFLTRARAVLAQLDGARTDLRELTDLLRGTLRVGATGILGGFDLPSALATFHRSHPGVALSLRTGLIAALLADLAAGELDVVVGPRHEDLLDGLTAHTLTDESLILATRPGHPPVHTLAEVSTEPFACLPPGSGLHTILTTAAAESGFTPHIPFQTHAPAEIRALVSAGLGVALLATSAANTPGPPIAVHHLTPRPAHPPIALIHTPTPPPTTRALRTQLSTSDSQET